jgi:LmbE family N-acetylglucosaminyl deacetylase
VSHVFSRRHVLSAALSAALLSASVRLKIVVAGGHPGDPECGCAGTMARCAALGHDVVLLYLNRGEGFCGGSDLAKCAGIRTAEAQKACQILQARPLFAQQVDGQAVVDNTRYQDFRALLDAEKPDILFTQWPVDRHRDHRAVSQLALDAWLQGGKKAAFYYYEVAEDTMMFGPAEFVDISDARVESVRRAACYAHASQNPDKWYPLQTELTRFRGSQCGHAQAEGFVRHWESSRGWLPQ